jgi:predicted phage tail protein
MKVVKVYGALRKKLGQCRFEFEAETPAQALKALCANFPWLTKWLLDSERDGVSYRVTIGKEKLSDQTAGALALPWSEKEVFSITPIVAGAGRGAGQIALGIGLIAFAIIAGPAVAAFGTAGTPAVGGVVGLGGSLGTAGSGFILGSAAATAIGGIGAALVLGGIAQALSPTPQISSLERGKEAARLESFSFSGIVNTSQQGLPVPIAYGRVFTGSGVISSALDVDQLK